MIITLCGSLRFENQFKYWNERLTLAGHTVFTVSVYPSDKQGVKGWYTPEQKDALDQAHLRKIDASDGILVINADNYIGPSTRNEILHAQLSHKRVEYICWPDGHTRPICRFEGCADPYNNHPPCPLCYD